MAVTRAGGTSFGAATGGATVTFGRSLASGGRETTGIGVGFLSGKAGGGAWGTGGVVNLDSETTGGSGVGRETGVTSSGTEVTGCGDPLAAWMPAPAANAPVVSIPAPISTAEFQD